MKKKLIILFYAFCFLFPLKNLIAQNVKPLVRIPFVTNGLQVYLELQLNGSGEKLNFAFDTGAGGTALDRNYISSSNVVLKDEKEEMKTSLNVVQVDVSENNRIDINGFEIEGVKLYIESLAHLTPSPNGKPVAGIIGYDLMKNYVTFINHEENYIELYPKGTQLYPSAKQLPFVLFENELPMFQATIMAENGKSFPVRLIFDSGAGFTCSLGSNFIAKNNLEQNLKVKVQIPVIGGAQSSSSVNYLSSLKQIEFGGFSFNHIPVNFSTSQSGASASDDNDGVIGFDLIKRFNVVLDYESKIIRLIPNKHYSSGFNFNLTGLSFRNKDKMIVVSGVMEYSPAKQAGVKEGDIIISVDGKTFNQSAELKNYLKGSYSAKSFVINRNGATLDIVIQPADFY